MGIQINFIQFLVEFMFYQDETKSLQIEDGLISFHKLEESLKFRGGPLFEEKWKRS